MTTKDLSIRYKILSGFVIILCGLAVLSIYLTYSYIKIQSSFASLISQSEQLRLYSKLNQDNHLLSGAVESYVITGNPNWVTTYNQLALEHENLLAQVIKSADTPKEKTYLNNYQEIMTKIKGTDLQTFEKAKDNNPPNSMTSFDSSYTNQQALATSLINAVTDDESSQYDNALSLTNSAAKSESMAATIISWLALVLSGFVALYFSSLITNSIKNLLIKVQEVTQGHPNVHIIIDSHDEIGQLATAFNEMTANLTSYQQSLEEKVADRTKQASGAEDKLKFQLEEAERLNDLMVDRELKMIELKTEIEKLRKNHD